jgi:putative tricarboxylic transport membrane protein
MFVLLGAYALNNSIADVFMTLFFGVLGYLLRRSAFEPAPLVLAFVLGPMMEVNLSKALIVFGTGNPLYFFTRPISGVLLSLALFVFCFPFLRGLGKRIFPRS